jgi:hypothetical protein
MHTQQQFKRFAPFQGEARVLKHMNNIMIDIKARRKRLQDEFEADSAYHKQEIMLKFVSDQKTREYRHRGV